jgi:exodeoxyribonuclease III
MAFRKKAAPVLALEPDILVVPECESIDKQRFPPGLRLPASRVWVGDNRNKGLGVIAYGAYELAIHPAYEPTLRYVVPIQVRGAQGDFILLAIWAMPGDDTQKAAYIRKVWLAVSQYSGLLHDPVVLAGDFNGNVIWDNNSRQEGNFSQTAALLAERGITSLYHRFTGEAFGQETQPTWYLYRQLARPFHLDYIFASPSFSGRLAGFEVGRYEQWAGLSDHMPVSATLLYP